MANPEQVEAPQTDASDDDAELDALSLSALLSSRVCHDLINPIGAIGSGIEVLEDPTVDDAMQDAAFDLIRSGAHKALALLKYARLAYGAAGGYGAQIMLEDAREALAGLYETVKAELDWRIEGEMAPKEDVKTLLILGAAAADCVPRGGVVSVQGDFKVLSIRAAGKRVLLHEDLKKALAGDARAIAPKFTPALIASQLIAEKGGRIAVQRSDEDVVFNISFDGVGV